MTITVLPLRLGKSRHDIPPFSLPGAFRKSPACLISEGLLPPLRLSEPSCPPASHKESSSGSAAASGFVLLLAAPAPLSCTFPGNVQLDKVWSLSRPLPSPLPLPSLWSTTCRKPPAQCPAGRCGHMSPRRPAGGAPAPPEVSGPHPSSPRARAPGQGRAPGTPGARKVAARGRLGEPAGSGERGPRGRAGARLAGDAWRASGGEPGAAGPLGDAPRPGRGARREPPRDARTPGCPPESGRKTWLRASPPPLTRQNRRAARGARRNPGVGGGAEPPGELGASLGAKEDANTKASRDPARCAGRREEPLRGAPGALGTALRLSSLPLLAGSETAAQGPSVPWQRPPQPGAACDARRRPRPPAFPAARADRLEGAGAAGPGICRGAQSPGGPIPTRSRRR